MTTVIGVRFKKVGKVYYFDPDGLTVKAGESVIVETARGIECGVCTMGNTDVDDSKIIPPLKKVVRVATETDLQVAAGNEQQAREAYQIARRKIEEHKLDMHLVAVECTFDLNKILFYFTADGRVDFRDLVKDLAAIFRTRIELRQIGVRDEAKMVGGLGVCGRELCCSSYLDEFQPVSINMAKEQNLSLNPAKISGTCGRLMCCLKYEHEAYVDLQKVTPKNESLVETPEGVGTVISTQMLRGLCKVLIEGEDEPRTFACTDCKVLRSGRARKCSGNCQHTPQPEIDPMIEVEPEASAEAPAQESRRKPRKEKEKSERPAKEQKPKEKSETETEQPKIERPVREKNGQPRLIKAVPKKEDEEVSKPIVRESVQPRLVKAAPPKEELEAELAAINEASAGDDEAAPEKKRRRRRRGGTRRRKNHSGENAPAAE
ncbi:MAG: hypothetical protein IJ042_02045 [Butyricicoccus sp.]|nr:hypothetical protein [Butyricicoccus sp.]